MGRRTRGSPPANKLHKHTGQAYVHVGGRRVYLGKYGTPASRREYERVVAAWRQEGNALPRPRGRCTTEALAALFREHAAVHYRRPDGTPTREASFFGLSLAPVLALYGAADADDFRGPELKRVREVMVAAGLCRKTVNKRVGRIRRVWRWGVSEGLVDPATLTALEAVADLQEGRTAAPDHEEVAPADPAVVAATLPFLPSDQLRVMVRLQLLTGMRPGEVCAMRGADLARDGVLRLGKRVVTLRPGSWAYVVGAKMAHARRLKVQVYLLGPRARAIVEHWLRDDPEEYLFSPAEAHVARMAALRDARKGPVQPSQADRRKDHPARPPGDHYTASSYAHAVAKACRKGGLPHWHPTQLRHAAAGLIDAVAGIEDTSKVLGHTSPNTTLVYLERDLDRVAEVMEKLG
jgi:integrase